MGKVLLACLVALAAALIMTPVAKWLAPKVGAIDKPNARKVHSRLMPRMGGLGIYAGFVAALLISSLVSL